MIMATSNKSAASIGLVVALVALCACTMGQCSERATGTNVREQAGGEEEQMRLLSELRSRHNNRLLAVPYSLARFLSYNARGSGGASPLSSAGPAVGEQTGGRQISGYKRSSSALDALTGVTLGKRSANPLEFVNFEPVFGRQSFSRGPPRVYDMRWAPVDSIQEAQSTGASSYLTTDYSN